MAELVDIEDIVKNQDSTQLNPQPKKTSCSVKIKHDLKKYNRKNQSQLDQQLDQEYLKQVPGQGKIYVKTFGCSHNISDSEFMMGQLSEFGYILTEKPDDADLILINSCTVKNPSQDAFINWVVNAKRDGKKVVVAGCVPQGDKKIKELDQLSVVGVQNIDRVVEVVNETFKGNVVKLQNQEKLPSLQLPKIRKNELVEIIPINAGCLGACTYCKTVQARGKLGSYYIDDILKRVKEVCSEGVKEIWLTSEDTGAYGRDIGTNISELLKKIIEVLPKNIMLRVGMTNPPYILAHIESIAKILNHPQVYAFLHIPVQAGNNVVLNKMNREYTVEEFKYCCDYLLEKVEGITLATDIICGFPEETDQEFEDTLKLVEHYKFRVLNISQFYPRPGTPAFRMKRVNTKMVKSRSRAITQLFESYQTWDFMEGKTVSVIITEVEEKKGKKQMVGHAKNYAKVLIEYDPSLIGQLVKVKIGKAHKWHLDGQVLQVGVDLESIDLQDYFKDYDVTGVTKREEKYQELIKMRLQRNNNDDNLDNIYTKFDLKENVNLQQTGQKGNKENYVLVLGIVLFVVGVYLNYCRQ